MEQQRWHGKNPWQLYQGSQRWKRSTYVLRFPFLILDIDPDSFALNCKGAQPKNPRQGDPVPSLWPGNPRLLLPRLYLGGTQRSGDHWTFSLCSKTIKICLSRRVFLFASSSNEMPTHPSKLVANRYEKGSDWLIKCCCQQQKTIFFNLEVEKSGEKKFECLSGSLARNGVWPDRQRTHPWPGETLRALDLDHSQRLVISG